MKMKTLFARTLSTIWFVFYGVVAADQTSPAVSTEQGSSAADIILEQDKMKGADLGGKVKTHPYRKPDKVQDKKAFDGGKE